jgi:hypothetical protein
MYVLKKKEYAYTVPALFRVFSCRTVFLIFQMLKRVTEALVLKGLSTGILLIYCWSMEH